MTLLEMLQERLPAMQKRAQELTEKLQAAQRAHQGATQYLQATQGEYNIAVQELNGLQVTIGAISRRDELSAKADAVTVQPTPVTIPVATATLAPTNTETQIPDKSQSDESSVNKTEIIRDVLRAHPNGLTPVEIWRSVKEHILRRSYVYAVLGRLKDRDQVTVRRGKYFFRATTKPEDVKSQEQSMPIQ
jgi:hypothetical protein